MMDNKYNAICIGKCTLVLQFAELDVRSSCVYGDRHVTAFCPYRHFNYISQDDTLSQDSSDLHLTCSKVVLVIAVVIACASKISPC